MKPDLRRRLSLTPEEAAEATGLSRETIYRAIRTGQLDAVKRFRRWLIRPAALDDFLRPSPEPLDPDVAAIVRRHLG